jgi:hypothetical protein
MRGALVGWMVVLACLTTGCGRKSQHEDAREHEAAGTHGTTEAPSEEPKSDVKKADEPRVQVPLGEGHTEDWGHLPFKITKLYEKQRLTKTSPFHADGGHWTFFDCLTTKGTQVRFSVGVRSRGQGKGQSAWGEAVLAVANRQAGDRFMSSFARAFHTVLPRPRPSAAPLEPLLMGTAILGEDLKRYPEGGFKGPGGGWTATKWFPQQNGLEAEVFFNYNLQAQEGEFCEKDFDYRRDLMTILALALRDGPRPDRTPENDPNLTLRGPRIKEIRCLLPRRANNVSFSPGGRRVVYEDGTTVSAVDPLHPDKPRELARFEHRLLSMHVLDENLRLLACEPLPESDTGDSSADPKRLWWIEPGGKGKRLLFGPEKGFMLADSPVSPDQRYVAIERSRNRLGKTGRYAVLAFLNRQTGKLKTAELPNESLSAAGWTGKGSDLRAVLVANRWKLDKDRPETVYLADPATGKLAAAPDFSVPDDEARPVSPDGKHRAEIEHKERLLVVDLATQQKRVFDFNEDDLPFVGEGCVKWAGPNYLEFHPGRLALIDISSMKMSYPTSRPAPGVSVSYVFSPDFRWVVWNKEEAEKSGFYLGRIVLPSD